jgi:hypothetical protein
MVFVSIFEFNLCGNYLISIYSYNLSGIDVENILVLSVLNTVHTQIKVHLLLIIFYYSMNISSINCYSKSIRIISHN